ncbi:triple tyrosine motif-containing protein [Lacinutrix chionoecetis]
MEHNLFKYIKLILLLGFTLITTQFNAQELPPINTFTPQQYNGENQNWAISQAQDQTIFVANKVGLIEYNGAKWTRYNSPNETTLRAVKVVGEKIYTGAYMEFGFWTRNAFGVLEYTSLSANSNIPLIEDEQFWQIINVDNWILFRSLNRIYIYDTQENTYKLIETDAAITKLYKVNDSIYFQDINYGIYSIVNGKKTLFLDNAIVKGNVVVNMYNYRNTILIQTENNGFYQYENNKLKPWTNVINSKLSNFSVYSSIRLRDGGFAFGTISHGLIVLNEEFELVYELNQNLGLSNNTILSIFEDSHSNIWLGLDNGINCVNSKSPIKIFNDTEGDLGSVYTSIIYEGNLYLGTNQGLFYRNMDLDHKKFTFIEGTKGQVWFLSDIDDQLFCGHNTGTFIITNNRANKIVDIQGAWSVKTIPNHPDLLLQGNYNGLNILEKQQGQWVFRNKIEGFDISSRFFEMVDDNTILISHEYKGVYKVTVDSDYLTAKNIEIDAIDNGLNSSLLKYNNKVYYVYKEGAFVYDVSAKSFKKDAVLSQYFNPVNYSSGKLIYDDVTHTLWGFNSKEIIYVKAGKLSSKPEIKKITLPNSLRNGVTSYENIIHIKDSQYLFGTSSGYLIIDISKFNNTTNNVFINSVNKSELNGNATLLPLDSQADLKAKENNIAFSYSVTQFDKLKVVEYQHQLLGIYDEWSSWSTTPTVRYKNLPSGNYTFNVRARVSENQSQNTASYQFYIGKPWYITNTATAIYLISFILLIIFLLRLYNRYHIKQRNKLLVKAERDLALKDLENKQQQMHFDNLKLQQDIDGKSRELAISTMSLIRKNELLNGIKKELNDIKSNNDIKQVVQIIDKNINNTDDWKFFQEAFNNADKDFLQKLKAEHSKLTPNDLKLCAYLRLNLSSKEIAPLLNISPRSVEVKRYRLRKKMNLPHETSLANYIIEL